MYGNRFERWRMNGAYQYASGMNFSHHCFCEKDQNATTFDCSDIAIICCGLTSLLHQENALVQGVVHELRCHFTPLRRSFAWDQGNT